MSRGGGGEGRGHVRLSIEKVGGWTALTPAINSFGTILMWLSAGPIHRPLGSSSAHTIYPEKKIVVKLVLNIFILYSEQQV